MAMGGQSAGKRKRGRALGGSLPNGVISPLQIEGIQRYRRFGLSFGEISEIMRIGKATAHKYGRDVEPQY